jgi:DNA-binding MarR family transcriptional regulator
MSTMVLDATGIADSEAETLATSMIEVSKLTRDLLAMHLATIALSPGEDDYMLALNPRQPTDIVEAAEELGVHRLAAAKCYELLAFRNLVEIQGDGVALTESGKDIRSQISTVYRMVGEDIAARLSVERLEVVRRALDEVKKNMKLALERRATCH